MSGLVRSLLVAVGALVVAAGPHAAFAPVVRAIDAYEGVRYVEVVETAPRPLRLHVATVDLGAPGIRITVSPPAGGRETVREPTLEFVRRLGAQLGVNAHFFLPFPSDDTEAWVIGLAASDGTVYSAFESPEQSFALVPDAPALRFDRRHRARIVHRARGDATGRRVRERGTVWNAVAGSAQIVTAGLVTIPTYRGAPIRAARCCPASAAATTPVGPGTTSTRPAPRPACRVTDGDSSSPSSNAAQPAMGCR